MRSNYSNRKVAILKTLLSIITTFLCATSVFTQESVVRIDNKQPIKLERDKDLPVELKGDRNELIKAEFLPVKIQKDSVDLHEFDLEITEKLNPKLDNEHRFLLKEESNESDVEQIKEYSFEFEEMPEFSAKNENRVEKFHWQPAIIQSFYFLGIQQSFRMVQKKTRRELDGEFFADWGDSVRNLGGWRDGDSFLTNYIAHPMQGAVTGRIFINNSDRSKKLEFGMSKDYWESRFKTFVWSAVWSAQFELGPFSEASIGNVGLYDREGPNRMGWVDLVVTPTAGTGAIIGEDLIDKFVLKKWLEKGTSRTRIKIFRTFFTPFQSFTNVLRLKAPWKRDNR